MQLKQRGLAGLLVLAWALPGIPTLERTTGTKDSEGVLSTRSLWQQPTEIGSRSLYYGPGGKARQPGRSFKFLKEDLAGSNPKFDVVDEKGIKWKVKLGNEAQPETAASRILWSVGYYADEDYLIKVLRVEGLPGRLSRGANLIQPDGSVLNARLKRHTQRKKVGVWSWRDSPFKRTREFDGLRVMMALLDNWDLKDENNAILDENGRRVYEVSDLGATFGTTRDLIDKDKAKGNVRSFEKATFVSQVSTYRVSFGTPAVPSVPNVFNPWNFGRRTRMRWIGKDIDRTHAKWIGSLLGQLSAEQIRDAFIAAGYSEPEAAQFEQVLKLRIAELNRL